MSIQIHTVPFGMVNAYLLNGEKCILIDTGNPGQERAFLAGLQNAWVTRTT
ncbi:MAG: hypothetical protein MUO62_17230 [Anaerolineales bacterium]|nr:hypothetical protein [Anaerolineales bacterium]